jgi:hypothetical protein
VIVSNPLYSILNKCLKKIIDNGVIVISLLILVIHITMPRIEMMTKRGCNISQMDFYNINEYMHIAIVIIWIKTNDKNIQVKIIYKFNSTIEKEDPKLSKLKL